MKGLILILFSLIPLISFSQNMIISGDATVKVHDGGKIIFSSSAPNNIQKSGSLGGILMMSENSEIIFKNLILSIEKEMFNFKLRLFNSLK